MTRLSKTTRNKILKLLQENPNLQRACKKVGVARSTVYRWMEDDEEFRDEIRDAQEIGRDSMNDYVEAKLMENIKDRNQKAVEFYLRHNNPRYAVNRVESEYARKHGTGRMMHLPVGVDATYYSGEYNALKKARLQAEAEQMVRELQSELRYSDEPFDIFKFDPFFAQAFLDATPGAKEWIKGDLEKYWNNKIREIRDKEEDTTD